ncbi:MAG: 4Fe-4S binding protein [Desulfobacterales bacterium]|nr:4Fe-4S binding protein [Desulfobacterales bacterium]
MAYTIIESCIGCEMCKKICPMNAIFGDSETQQKINPELCIECGSCGRICPKNAIVDSFGIPAVSIPKSQWKQPHIILKNCTSCGSCVDICPVHIITISHHISMTGKHVKPEIKDIHLCISCGFCALKCPVNAIEMKIPE